MLYSYRSAPSYTPLYRFAYAKTKYKKKTSVDLAPEKGIIVYLDWGKRFISENENTNRSNSITEKYFYSDNYEEAVRAYEDLKAGKCKFNCNSSSFYPIGKLIYCFNSNQKPTLCVFKNIISETREYSPKENKAVDIRREKVEYFEIVDNETLFWKNPDFQLEFALTEEDAISRYNVIIKSIANNIKNKYDNELDKLEQKGGEHIK